MLHEEPIEPPRTERSGDDRLLRNSLLLFAALCLAGALLFMTVPTARAGFLVAYEQMYKAMVTMAAMCGF